jgi:hypothetical protein
MRRAVPARPMGVLYLVLAIALSVAGAAPPAPPAPIGDLADQRRALYQAELEQNLLLRTRLGYGFIAALGPLRATPKETGACARPTSGVRNRACTQPPPPGNRTRPR